MTAGATIEEQIIDDVQTSILAINGGPTWNFDMRRCQRQDRNPLRVEVFPTTIMVHLGTDQDDQTLGMIKCLLRLGLVICLRTERISNWPEDLELLASDVSNKLRTDWTRGGLATDTRISNKEIFDEDEMGGLGIAAAQLTAEIIFRHQYADTTAAI